MYSRILSFTPAPVHPRISFVDLKATDIVFTATAGQPVEIRLESGAGAGAIWQLDTPSEGATVERRDSRLLSTGVGGVAQQVFVFQSARPGTHALVFELKRPWEPTVRRRQRVIVRVESTY